MYIPVGWRQICIENDSNAESVAIEVPRYYGKDKTDLSQYAMYLKTVSEGGRDDILLTPETEEETLVAVWTPCPPQTSYPGPLYLQLRFEGENFKWETPISQIEILPSADAQPAVPATPSAYEGWLQNVQAAADSILDMTVSAETLPAGSSATVEKTVSEGVFNLNFGIPAGVTGETGNGVSSVELLSASGLAKTYRMTFTDGTYFDYTVNDGDISGSVRFDEAQSKTDAEKATAQTNIGLGNANAELDILKTVSAEKSDETLWENGIYAAANGEMGSSARQIVVDGVSVTCYGIRTKEYLSENIIAFSAKEGCYPFVFAFSQSDGYIGWWNGSEFVKTVNTAFSDKRSFNISALRKTYPTYSYKIVIYDINAVSAAPAVFDVLENFGVYFKTLNEEDIETAYTPLMRWETGSLSSTGQPSGSTNTARMRCCDYIQIKANEFDLNVPTGYVARYCIYNAEKTFQFMSANVREKSVTVPVTAGWYIKLFAWNTSETEVSPAEGSKITVTFRASAIGSDNTVNKDPQDYASVAMFRNIAVIGDSFASGALYDPSTASHPYVATAYELSWIQVMARRNGIAASNFSTGGLNVKTWLEHSSRGLAALLAADPQNIYIIALGINDKKAIDDGDMDLGTLEDVNVSDHTQNPDTFYGNYGRIIGNILAHAPKAKIVCLSVAREGQRSMDEHIKAVAEKYGVPFIDLTEEPYFTSEIYYGSMAGGHPLAYGYAGMGRAIERLLQKCVIVNSAYFADYTGQTT